MIDSLKLDNQLCFTVYALSREITKIYRPILESLGLTYTQYLVMIVLWEQDGQCLKDLGRRLLLDSGTLTPLLKKLEAEGLILRTKDRKDERNLIVNLTNQGRKLLAKAEVVPEEMRCRIPLADEEIVDLRNNLRHILEKLVEGERQKKKEKA